MPNFARALFGFLVCSIALCALAKPAAANCALASKYVAASAQAEQRLVNGRVFVSGDALDQLTSDATAALTLARQEPCDSKAVAGSIDALDAWYQMEDNYRLWSMAEPTTANDEPNPPECIAYYAAESKVVRANTWYLLWQSYRAGYRGDLQWWAAHSMDETNAHIPLALPPYSVNPAVAADTKNKYTGELSQARKNAGSLLSGDSCSHQ
jgi:hypothetical protein